MFLFQPLPAAGSPTLTGDLSATLGAITLASTAKVAVAGTSAVTLGAVVLVAAGTLGATPSVGTGGRMVLSWGRGRRGRLR